MFKILIGAFLFPSFAFANLYICPRMPVATAVTHEFLTSISASGATTLAQPAFTDISGSVAATQMPALIGDVTSTAGTVTTSLVATSNATLTTLSGLTSASSLSTVGTITTGTWNGTTIAFNHGGTGGTTVTGVKTSTYAIAATDFDVLTNTSGGAFTVTLPTAATAGETHTIKLVTGGNKLTIATTSAQTIDGLSNYFMGTTNDAVTVVADGSNWHVSLFNIEAGIRVHMNAAQSIPNNTNTFIKFDTTDTDPLGQWSAASGTFTATYPGLYQINCSCQSAAVAWTTAEEWDNQVVINAAGKDLSTIVPETNFTGQLQPNIVTAFALAATGTISCQVFQSQGGAVNTLTTNRCQMSILRTGN